MFLFQLWGQETSFLIMLCKEIYNVILLQLGSTDDDSELSGFNV